MDHSNFQPKVILLLSGKRKSGKDFIAEKLHATLGAKSTILRISEPIKAHYAKHYNLNLTELLSENTYKEKYRQDMIIWSDNIREVNPGYFCREACVIAPNKDIWIVSDIRRKTDIEWFRTNYKNTKTIRIFADNNIRTARGWVFTKGVDDVASECNLDDWSDWNLEITNNDELYKNCIENILTLITTE